MLWIKAFHLIALIAWFSGLFYLPRLFVYHASTEDGPGRERFKIMERKLYRYIMTPAAITTLLFGIILLSNTPQYYMKAGWMHAKLTCVIGLFIFHFYCGQLVRQFAENNNKKSEKYYRILNEVPTVFLFAIVILVVVKPF